MPDRIRRSCLLALLVCSVVSNALGWDCPGGTDAQTPDSIPPGWIADYSYNSDPLAYLNGKYEEASARASRLYVYFYTDFSSQGAECRKLRSRFIRSERVRQSLQGATVVMIEARQFNCILAELLQRPVSFVRSAPVLVRVLAGPQFGESFEPRLFRNYSDAQGFQSQNNAEIARKLEQYYQKGEDSP